MSETKVEKAEEATALSPLHQANPASGSDAPQDPPQTKLDDDTVSSSSSESSPLQALRVHRRLIGRFHRQRRKPN